MRQALPLIKVIAIEITEADNTWHWTIKIGTLNTWFVLWKDSVRTMNQIWNENAPMKWQLNICILAPAPPLVCSQMSNFLCQKNGKSLWTKCPLNLLKMLSDEKNNLHKPRTQCTLFMQKCSTANPRGISLASLGFLW